MVQEADVDVAVVGSGVAGSAAAILLGKQGLKVALIEKSPNPEAFKSLCTHFIQPSATPTIERLGLAAPIEEAGGLRNSLRVWTRWGWIEQPDRGPDAPYGYSIRRQKLDPLLRSAAAELEGVDLWLGWSAAALMTRRDRVVGVRLTDAEGNAAAVTARLVVAADGRHSKLAELAGVKARKLANKRSGYFAYYEGLEPDAHRTSMWFLDPDIAYAFPNDDGLTILACMFGRKRNLDWFRKDPAANLLRTFERLPEGPDLSSARRVSKVLGAVDLPNQWRRPGPGGLAFVGDAMLAADPLWGVGCGWAFQSAEWLSESLAGALDSEGGVDRAVASYRATVRRRLLGHYLMTSEYSRDRRFNPAERMLFSAAVHDDVLARKVHLFGARILPVHQFLAPSTMIRAARVSLTHRPDRELVKTLRRKAAEVNLPPAVAAGSDDLPRDEMGSAPSGTR